MRNNAVHDPPPPPVATARSVPEPPHYHTQTHHTRYDSSGRVISPTQRPLPDNTQHSQATFRPPTRFEPAFPAHEWSRIILLFVFLVLS